jgi:hypothetical protein
MNEFTSEGFKALYTKINHINPKTRGVLNSYDIFNNYKDKDKD